MKKLLFAALLGLPTLTIYSQATPPNIIFITFDDMNDWVQGFSGQVQASTPNIQYFAKRGTSFLNAYVTGPMCGPSRTSIFTGKDCNYTKIYHNVDLGCGDFRANFTAADDNEVIFTLPEILKDSGGYFTYSIGKTLHCTDNEGDYDETNPDMCGRNLSWNKLVHFDTTYGEQDEIVDYGSAHEQGVHSWAYCVLPDSMEPLMQDYLSTDTAIQFISEYASDPSQYCNKPFFLALGFRKPHAPYYIPEKYFSSYYNDDYYSAAYDLPYNYPTGSWPPNGFVMPPQPDTMWSDFDALPEDGVARAMIAENPVHGAVLGWVALQLAEYGLPPMMAGMTDEEKQFAFEESRRANLCLSYQAAIKFADAQLGRLIDELKLHPAIFNNTIVVIMGDHGYSLGEKTHWKKGALWETDIRSPLIIADMRAPAKRQSKRFVNFLDIFPTICDYAGVEYPTFPDGSPYLDGYSMTPLMINPVYSWFKPVLTSFRNTRTMNNQGSCFPSYSVRDDEWHYIRYFTNGDYFPFGCDAATSVMQEELYHIGKKKNIDPNEWNNLADNPAYDYVKDYLATYLPDGENYLQFEKSVAFSEQEDGISLILYPNPASDHVTLMLSECTADCEMRVVNALGEIMDAGVLPYSGMDSNLFLVDIRGWPAGLYFVELNSGGQHTSGKFLVVR